MSCDLFLARHPVMKRAHLHFGPGFRVLMGNEFSQAAQMTLAPGEHDGSPDKEDRGADQWLFVVSGQGEAVINREKFLLKAGVLLLIERGDEHEIRNTGRNLLRTLNLYVPPAVTPIGTDYSSTTRRTQKREHRLRDGFS